MTYTNSPLVTYTRLTKHKTSPRNHTIDTITIHCIVGQLTAKEGCDYFATTERECSANYVVGKDGSIGLSVEEKDRSWCSSSRSNDHRAITIEVASDKTHPYAVTDAAYDALIKLVADICKRNNIKELKWKGDKALIGQVDKQNMTVHRWFANKSCPGDYLYERHSDIAAKVNAILTDDKTFKMRTTKPEAGNKYYITKASGGYSAAIKGNIKHRDKECDVLPNCVGYAYGRFNEIGGYGYCKYLYPTNAENFIQYKGNLEVGQVPKVGACMVWQKGKTLSGSDGAGHVAIVEKVVSETEVYTSESGWSSSKPFWNQTRKKGSGNWGQGSAYKFLGFIYNPAVKDEPLPKPSQPSETTKTIKVNDIVKVANGATYYDGKKTVPAWVIKKQWIVKSVSGDMAIIDKSTDGKNSIRSPINVKYLTIVTGASTSAKKKTDKEIAKEVIQGKWGNGETRKRKLEAAGYNYRTIQNLVNEMLR
jgi:surface antigen